MIRRIGGLKGIYRSVYPPAYNSTYVKSTTDQGNCTYAYLATDISKSLVGSYVCTGWMSASGYYIQQRFHIDLGIPIVVNRIYYENLHNSGANTNLGVNNFTFWGSNVAAAFAELTYATNTNWSQLTTSVSAMTEHVALNQVDPKYVTVTNSLPYRYYAVKFADTQGGNSFMGIRRIELQVMV